MARDMRGFGARRDYLQALRQGPGTAGEPPSTHQRSLDPRDQPGPSTPAAQVAAEILLDPWAREELGLLLEETFRNFMLHTKGAPWVEPPFKALEGGIGSIVFGTTATTLGSSSGWTDLLTGDVPPGNVAYLRKFGQGVDDASGWDDVDWRFVRRDLGAAAGDGTEVPIYPYNDIVNQIGQIDIPTDIWIMLRGPVTWAVQGENSSGSASYLAGVRVDGWRIPSRVNVEGIGGAIVD